MAKKEKTTTTVQALVISPPNFKILTLSIRGTSAYVQNKFGAKARQMMLDKQESGHTAKKGAKRDPKDFDALYHDAQYKTKDGWFGIPCVNFRDALVSACKLAGFAMTRAKLSILVLSDGICMDPDCPAQLVRINGLPRKLTVPVRNASGVADLRIRPMFEKWTAKLRIRFDADQFSETDVANLVMRAGMQVGVGEGRPDSPESCGLGWGMFEIENRNVEAVSA